MKLDAATPDDGCRDVQGHAIPSPDEPDDARQGARGSSVTVNKWEHGVRPITRVVELAMWGLIFFDERDPSRRRPPSPAAQEGP